MGTSNWVHVTADEVLADTGKAFLFRIQGEDHWIPRACVADPERYEEGDVNVGISITQGVADDKGIDPDG